MSKIRIATSSLNQTPLDWRGNADNIRAALLQARDLGASLVCLPELCISGYGCEDAFLWSGTLDMARRVLGELLEATAGLVACLGLPLEVDGCIHNVAALVADGELVGFAAKRHLAGGGLHYEPRWFSPWPVGKVSRVQWGGRSVPVGDLVFELSGVRIGFEICEDAWVSERPGRELARTGVHVLLNPSASHFAFGKHSVRRGLALAGAAEFGCIYAYANLLGNEAGRAIYDGDALIARPAPSGAEIVAEARRLSVKSARLACATTVLPLLGSAADASGQPSRHRQVIEGRFVWPDQPRMDTLSEGTPSADAQGELCKEEAFSRVVALGLLDYLRKSRSHGFVVSLSGGADSAACAVLVRLMVRLAIAEVGLEELLLKLPYLEARAASEEELCGQLLATIYQATNNSSEVTRRAAAGVARATGSTHHEVSVQELVSSYRALTEEALGRALSWETDDVALQNIQARARAPGAWMLANVSRRLLLATSNRSEVAVGYATMDGDTAGGLSPIAGIDKTFLRQWLRWMETVGPEESGPLSVLAAVNEQAPTAELRPLGQDQTDEKDLMPYDVLDAFERGLVFQRRPLREVFWSACSCFPQYTEATMFDWFGRFCRLFSANQWKRERYAPSFHLDDGNLDPRSWCRFPILSGAFSRELDELAHELREDPPTRPETEGGASPGRL